MSHQHGHHSTGQHPAHPPFALRTIEKHMDKVVVGETRVQNYWGDGGIVRWIGQMKGPWGKGQYAAVEYDNANPFDERRGDGEFEGTRLCQTPPQTCAFSPLRHLYFEINPLVIDHLRKKFGDSIKHFNDFELVKVGIARQFDAEAMDKTMENHLKWYETYHPNPAVEWFHPRLGSYFPNGMVDACDREGNLLHFSRPGLGGQISPADVVKEFGVEPVTRMITIQHEEMKANLRAKGYAHHRRYTSVYDLKDLGSIDGKTMDFAKALAEVNKNHQLEIVGKIVMINCSFMFRAVFKTISIFMDERTRDKVVVLGSDYQEEVAKYIDPKNLPSFAGGTNDKWLEREGRVGQPAPEADPTVTHGTVGQPYDNENMFPKAKKAAEKAEKEKLKAEKK
eukprot:GILI01004994.1.p1 GENE.GILI01004994.1~~GILI01004994.1.p1  ORF type:complete len:394 (+),score=133.14 GILI01004994.1:161-1342(+)